MRVGDKVRVIDNSGCSQLKVGDIHTITEIQLGCDLKPMVYVDDNYGMYANRFKVIANPTMHVVTDDLIPAIFAVIENADKVTQAHDEGTITITPGDSICIAALKNATATLHKLLADNHITKSN